ncbi:MAG: AbrB/MazE/SpoVT family DNA-binding domain-containing protein [Syntrophorhabdales bacterium]|jgi:AbrB family looped-hinge helix DNA binding protein
MTVAAKVTSKGQITLSREVRKLLAVGKGSVVIFETKGDRVFLKPVKTLRVFKGALKGRKPAADFDAVRTRAISKKSGASR